MTADVGALGYGSLESGRVFGRLQDHRFRPDGDLDRTGGKLAVGQAKLDPITHADGGVFAVAVEQLRVEDIGVADEVGDEEIAGCFVELVRRPLLRDLRVAHDDDPVRHRQGLLLVVGDVDRRQREALLQLADFLPDLAAQLGVEVGEGFVEQQDGRFQDQGAGDGDPLLLSAGQLARQTLSVAGKTHQLQAVFGPVPDLRLGDAAHREAVGHVLEHGHVRKQGVGLKHHGDVPGAGRQAGDVVAADEDAARGGHFQAGDEAEGRRLAASARPQQRHQVAHPNFEGYLIDRDDRPVVLADVVERNRGVLSLSAHPTAPPAPKATFTASSLRPMRR